MCLCVCVRSKTEPGVKLRDYFVWKRKLTKLIWHYRNAVRLNENVQVEVWHINTAPHLFMEKSDILISDRRVQIPNSSNMIVITWEAEAHPSEDYNLLLLFVQGSHSAYEYLQWECPGWLCLILVSELWLS